MVQPLPFAIESPPDNTATLPPEVLEAINAGVLIVTMDCTSAEQPGDIVRLAATVNTVARCTNNTSSVPAIGWIKDKPVSATSCRVVVKGVITASSLAPGRVYLGIDGLFTLVSPANSGGYRQPLGYSFGNGKINLDPDLRPTLNA